MLGFLDEELVDDSSDQVGARGVDGMRLARHDDQPSPG